MNHKKRELVILGILIMILVYFNMHTLYTRLRKYDIPARMRYEKEIFRKLDFFRQVMAADEKLPYIFTHEIDMYTRLHRRVRTAADDAGVHLTTAGITHRDTLKPYQFSTVALHLEVVGSGDGIRQFIKQVEDDDFFTVPQKITITSRSESDIKMDIQLSVVVFKQTLPPGRTIKSTDVR